MENLLEAPSANMKVAMSFGIDWPTPVQINGTRMKLGERYSGPPSKMLPMLRDLAAHDPDEYVVVEIDTAKSRREGVVTGLIRGEQGALANKEHLQISERNSNPHSPRNAYGKRGSIQLELILAFRILRVVSAHGDPKRDNWALVVR